MKNIIICFAMILIAVNSYCQTNIFEKNGNIGIGTSDPKAKLDVNGSIKVGNNNSIAFDRGGSEYSTFLDAYAYPSKGYPSGGNANYWLRFMSKGGAHFVLNTDGEVGSAENNTDFFTIWQAKVDGDKLLEVSNIGNTFIKGNVGIGIPATPTHRLAINGSIKLTNGNSIAFENGTEDYSTHFDAYGYPSKGYSSGGNANYWLRFMSKGGTHFVLNTDGEVGSAENNTDFFTIWQSKVDGDKLLAVSNIGNTFIKGDVGIGTTTTGTHKLAVDGTIGAREIKVEATGWSDFVFENDYKLKDLENVESFIKENKHLPEVPSEKEVLENGIQLGEMDAKLLQKIEELTLYTIRQEKEIKALKLLNKKFVELQLRLEKLESKD